jgi:tetratricopeptide (TPR) repeat protein
VKHFKNGFMLVLAVVITSSILYLAISNPVRQNHAAGLERSLELNKKAVRYIQEGKHDEAYPLLQESLALNCLNPVTHVHLGFVYLEQGDYQQAYEYFVHSFNLGGLSPEVTYELAELLLRSGHYKEAVFYLRDGIKEFPEEKELSLQLGKAYCLAGDHDRSLKVLSELVENEEMNDAYKYMGLSHYARGEEEEAEKNYHLYLESIGIPAVGSISELHSLVWEDEDNG